MKIEYEFPSWLPTDLSNAKLERIGPRIRLRGKDADPARALEDYLNVLEHSCPEGYILSHSTIDAEHERGPRLTWQIVWLREEIATRRYAEKQATRMSRYELNPNEETT